MVTVSIGLTVQSDGTASAVTLSKSSGSDCLDESAIEAVKQYTFHPAMKDGMAVASALRLNLHFGGSPEKTKASSGGAGDGSTKDDGTPTGEFSKSGSPVYRFGGEVKPPVPIDMPELGFAAGGVGASMRVTVSLIVSERGRPENLNIVKSSDPRANSDALECVNRYRFRPATLHGRPVAVRMQVELNKDVR